MLSKYIWSVGNWIDTSTKDNNRLWKLIENYGRMYKKEELLDMFRLIRIIIGNLDLERFRI